MSCRWGWEWPLPTQVTHFCMSRLNCCQTHRLHEPSLALSELVNILVVQISSPYVIQFWSGYTVIPAVFRLSLSACVSPSAFDAGCVLFTLNHSISSMFCCCLSILRCRVEFARAISLRSSVRAPPGCRPTALRRGLTPDPGIWRLCHWKHAGPDV